MVAWMEDLETQSYFNSDDDSDGEEYVTHMPLQWHREAEQEFGAEPWIQ